MKRKHLLLITGLALVLGMTGCGNSEKTAETETTAAGSVITGYLIDGADQYVTLGIYKNLPVEKPIYEVTDDEISMEIENYLYEKSDMQQTDRGAEAGDVVTVDLKATVEGAQEPDLDETDYAVELGYEEFGADFDQALTGCQAGDSKTVSCSFTEEDGYEDWAGKTVNFEISVKAVEELVVPKYDDAFITDMGYNSQEDFENYIRESLEASYREQSEAEARSNAILAALDNTQFEGYPDKLYDSCADSVNDQYKFFADAYGMSMDEVLEAFDMTQEDLDSEILETVNTRLFISALCQAENITATDEEYTAFIDQQFSQYGYEEGASFEADYGKETILWALYEQKAADFLLENASVDEVTYSYDGDDYDESSEYGEELEAIEDTAVTEETLSQAPENTDAAVAEEQQNGD